MNFAQGHEISCFFWTASLIVDYYLVFWDVVSHKNYSNKFFFSTRSPNLLQNQNTSVRLEFIKTKLAYQMILFKTLSCAEKVDLARSENDQAIIDSKLQ